MQNAAPKTTKYSRNDTILKSGHHGKAIVLAQWLFWERFFQLFLVLQLACWLKVIGNTNSAEQRFVLTELGFVFFLNVSEAYVVNRGLQGRRTKNNDKYLVTL